MIQSWEKFRDGRTDRQTGESDFIGYFATNVERSKGFKVPQKKVNIKICVDVYSN